MGRAIAGHVPPMAITMLRWLLAAAILFPFVRPYLKRDWPLIRARLGVLTYLSLLGGALFGALQFVGLQFTTALNVSVMNSLGPVTIGAASAVMFRDRLTAGQFAGIIVSLTGVLAIITQLDPGVLTRLTFNIGDVHHPDQHGAVGRLFGLAALAPGDPSAQLHGHVRADLGRRDAAVLRLGAFDRLRAAADAVDVLGDRVRDGVLHHHGVHVLGARRRADRRRTGQGSSCT